MSPRRRGAAAAPAEIPQGFSFGTESAVEGGVYWDNNNMLILRARFTKEFDYGGTRQPSCALELTLQPDDWDEEYTRYYSVGSLNDWDVLEDGSGLIPLKEQEGIRNNCNLNVFMAALKAAGVPEKYRVGNDITKIEGLYGFWQQVDPKDVVEGMDRSGIERSRDEDEEDDDGRSRRSGLVLVPTKILTLPDDDGSGGDSGATGSAAAAPRRRRRTAAAAAETTGTAEETGGDESSAASVLKAYLDEAVEAAGDDGVAATAATRKTTQLARDYAHLSAADLAGILKDADALAEIGYEIDEAEDGKRYVYPLETG